MAGTRFIAAPATGAVSSDNITYSISMVVYYTTIVRYYKLKSNVMLEGG